MQPWDVPQVKVRVGCECGYRTAYKLVTSANSTAPGRQGLARSAQEKCPSWDDASGGTGIGPQSFLETISGGWDVYLGRVHENG
jgi:hypothetical protein